MDKDLRILAEIKHQIEKAYINFKKSPKERITEIYIESRLEILEKAHDNFSSKYEVLIGSYGREQLSKFFEEDIFEAVSEVYLAYRVELKKVLSKFKIVTSDLASEVSSNKAKGEALVKLPKIKIPTFSGKYTEWSSFRDLFVSLIHNNSSLDNVQKLHYLKTQLTGEAEQLIRHVPITQANYKQCWDVLERRYNNKKFMSTCILKRLFCQRNMIVESASALKELLDVTSDCLHELSNLGIDVKSWDVIVIYVVSLKLDVESRKQWELQVSQSSEDLPSWLLFKEFLETRFRALEFVEPRASKVSHNNVSHPKVMHGITKVSCPHCSEDHKLFHCKKFAKEDVDQRRDIVQSLGVCFNCMGSNHSAKVCRVFTKCRICHRKHHTLLHPKNQSVNTGTVQTETSTEQETCSDQPQKEIKTNIATHFLKGNANGQVLLATALVKAESIDGSSTILRALLDQGSQSSFITEAAAQLLKLKRVATKAKIAGIGGGLQSGTGVVSRYVVTINIKSLHDPSYIIPVTAHVLGSLTSVMPDAKFDIQDWPEIHGIQLADPNFNSPSKIDLLLGADIFCNILKAGLIRSPKGSPVAQDTYLGWIVSGFVHSEETSHNQHNTIISLHALVEQNDMPTKVQIKMAREDTDHQRIVWREDPSHELKDFRLLRVTFGISCAPYLAVKSLQKLALDDGVNYPLTAERVLQGFYIDDLMTGCQSETEAVKIYKGLNELLENGGFKSQKCFRNSIKLLEKLEEGSGRDMEIKTDNVTKVLGLTWNRNTDEFDYSVKMSPPTAPETKRTVISEISKLYDPLGWIAPCIITSKVFIQKLWVAGVGWDEELSLELLQEWKHYRDELNTLIKFHIPRWFGKDDKSVVMELHAFGDASDRAFATAVYSRIVDVNGLVHCHLLAAKTKVAPIKQLSISRLELNAAVLAAKLLTDIGEVLKVPKSNLHAWTDSSVVLAWLSDHPSRWNTYVANRTSEILTLLDNSQWAHVESKENPADIASRGATPTVLLQSSLWKHGPSWLCNQGIEYSKPSSICTKLEKKSAKVSLQEKDNSLWTKFSSLRKLIRVIALCRRIISIPKLRQSNIKLTPFLSVHELKEASMCCIHSSQIQSFGKEIQLLSAQQPLPKKSPIYKLTPFIDNCGLLRVGGRTGQCQLSDNAKHPVIIAYDSFLTKLIIADAHEKTFHGGQQLVLNVIRTKYWIPRVKNAIRAYIHDGVSCIRYAAPAKNPLMGELPACRITPSKPFSNSGVDYAAPIKLRVSKGRGQRSYKGYICLFVCMVCRAVHLEAVSDLTSEGFLVAFKRFVSRRGHGSHLWSDNGTNFVCAAKELKAVFAEESDVMNKTPRPNDPTPLSPGHFLVGSPLVVTPDYNYENSAIGSLRRWQLVQRMVQSFWRRWNQEYLTQFFQRHKWAAKTPDLKVGDVVLIKEDNLPPAKWLLGRIDQVHPGKDNITRVVTVRCKGSLIRRPASKLCLLPVTE